MTPPGVASRLGVVPDLRGRLLTDPASRRAAADDFGHIVHQEPLAVLRPGSVDDVVRIVRHARERGLKIGARGNGHSTYGHAQVGGGIVVDLSALSSIQHVDAGKATVDAGVTWDKLLSVVRRSNLTPPVLTDHLGLTVGGTLSVGGVSGNSFRYGAQVDHVLDLEVVTGEGHLEFCSQTVGRDLFDAVLAGLGQCGIIVRAGVRLVTGHNHVRVFRLQYRDCAAMIGDLRQLVVDERFDYVLGVIAPGDERPWEYSIEAASFSRLPARGTGRSLLVGLNNVRESELVEDRTEIEWAGRVSERVAALEAVGVWTLPHPWLDLFVPGSAVDEYLHHLLAAPMPDDAGRLGILLYPLRASRFSRPLLRLPQEEIVFLCDVLRTAPRDSEVVGRMLLSNRELFERNRDLGGTHYAISALPLSRAEWEHHFGTAWGAFVKAKRRHDPAGVLTPGVDIFE